MVHSLVELLLDRDEQRWLDDLEFDIRLVVDPFSDEQLVPALTFNRVLQEFLLRGQGAVRSGTDFGQHQVVVPESNDVAIGRDVDLQRIVIAFDHPLSAYLNQLGMDFLSKQVKAEVS